MLKLKLQYFVYLIVKRRLTRKDPDAQKDWGQEEKWAVEDETIGWQQGHSGHEFEQTLGDKGQGSLVSMQSMGSQIVGHDLTTEQQEGAATFKRV